MNNQSLDFNEPFFGDIHQYKKLCINLMTSLKDISHDDTLYEETGESDLLSELALDISDLLLTNMDSIAENLYSNDIIVHEFPLFLEARKIIEQILMDPLGEYKEYLNLAIDVFSDYFTLLEVKLLLFQGCKYEMQASDEICEEYDKELNNYVEHFKIYSGKFIEMNKIV